MSRSGDKHFARGIYETQTKYGLVRRIGKGVQVATGIIQFAGGALYLTLYSTVAVAGMASGLLVSGLTKATRKK